MATFSDIDRRLSTDEKQLHDFLWSPSWKGDQERLISNLVGDAQDLDAFLGAKGKLSGPAEVLAEELASGRKEGVGESLFEMLSHVFFLAAAAEVLKRGDYDSAGGRLQEVVGSVTIGVCANAGCFEYVQEWEGGKVDFGTYTSKMASFLQEKGVDGVHEWARLARAAYDLPRFLGVSSSSSERELLTRAAVLNACWVTRHSLSIRDVIGSPPRFPAADFSSVVEKVSRLV